MITTCAVSHDSAMNSVNNINKLGIETNHMTPIFIGGCLSNAAEKKYVDTNAKFFTADDIFEKIDAVTTNCRKRTHRCAPFWLPDIPDKLIQLNQYIAEDYDKAVYYSFVTDGLVFSHMPFNFGTIRISKGCNKKCSYCAIPNNRGKYMEHSLEQIEEQLKNSIQDTILLIGENIGQHKDLVKILELAIRRYDKKVMLRYLEPEHIKKLDDVLWSWDRIPYIGVPIQSASKKVLRDMRRPGNVEEVKEYFKEWQEVGIRTGTSIILNYPTERFVDYLKTAWWIITTPVDYISFQNFSPRENSVAWDQYKDYSTDNWQCRLKFWFFEKIVHAKAAWRFKHFKKA